MTGKLGIQSNFIQQTQNLPFLVSIYEITSMESNNCLWYFTGQNNDTGPIYKSKISVALVYPHGKLENSLWPFVNILPNTHVDSFKTETMVSAQKLSLLATNRKSTSSTTDIFFEEVNHTIFSSAWRYTKFWTLFSNRIYWIGLKRL